MSRARKRHEGSSFTIGDLKPNGVPHDLRRVDEAEAASRLILWVATLALAAALLSIVSVAAIYDASDDLLPRSVQTRASPNIVPAIPPLETIPQLPETVTIVQSDGPAIARVDEAMQVAPLLQTFPVEPVLQPTPPTAMIAPLSAPAPAVAPAEVPTLPVTVMPAIELGADRGEGSVEGQNPPARSELQPLRPTLSRRPRRSRAARRVSSPISKEIMAAPEITSSTSTPGSMAKVQHQRKPLTGATSPTSGATPWTLPRTLAPTD